MKEEYLNERMETMSPGELRALQEQKFLKQLDYVWQGSAFYQTPLLFRNYRGTDIRRYNEARFTGLDGDYCPIFLHTRYSEIGHTDPCGWFDFFRWRSSM